MKVKLNEEKCVNCGICEQVCPHIVFSSETGIMKIISEPSCIECGACQKNCPVNAITVQSGVG